MKASRRFTVRTQLPDALGPLQALATNLRWSWDDRTRRLFRWVDPELWEATQHDPVRLLATVSHERLTALALDPSFMAFLDEIHDDLERYLDSPGWLQLRGPTPLRAVAYFSPEFGLSEAIPQYSGGLGVLAGDHLKAASGLGLPLTGVGLFYRQGYFRQTFDRESLQVEDYPILDPHLMALAPAPPLNAGFGAQVTVSIDLAGTSAVARVWRAQVGRVALYMLDTDCEPNDPHVRAVTDRLYGGGEEHRIRQEIVLGIGGVRALQALGIETQVFHLNEGHAGFLGLERIRLLMRDHGLDFDEAIEACRAGTVFTTHTPVPAGIDRFPRPLMEKYFAAWADECGVGFDRFMALGQEPGQPPDAPFNMAVMGLRLSGRANGVSQLHGRVSRRMFSNLWEGVTEDEVPIGAVTNGVHARTWVSQEMGDLFDRYVLPEWTEAGDDRWGRIFDCPPEVLWRVREETTARMIDFVRIRLRAAAEARGQRGADAAWCDRALDPSVLTVGFARRFATYKRATLLLSDPDRLRALLLDPDRPMQLVFAGKAHPADGPGKEMIRQLIEFSLQPDVRHRIAFVENYDIGVARLLYQGTDVWLNNPRRPLEACGTSGMKATLNGALNCSVLDGWFDEWYRPATNGAPANGWAIPSAESAPDQDRDRLEAAALFDLLEREIVPLFYDRPNGAIPRRWVHRVQHSLATLGPLVMASRMVKDYTTDYYEPAAAQADAIEGDETVPYEAAKELAAWKRRVTADWPAVKIVSVDDPSGHELVDVGAIRDIRATIELGPFRDDEVEVELLHGLVGLNDEIDEPSVTRMEPDPSSPGLYSAHLECSRAGRYGYTVRVVPRHRHVSSWAEVGLATTI